MHLKYAKMLAIVVHKNMKLGDNTLNNQIKLFTIGQLLNLHPYKLFGSSSVLEPVNSRVT